MLQAWALLMGALLGLCLAAFSGCTVLPNGLWGDAGNGGDRRPVITKPGGSVSPAGEGGKSTRIDPTPVGPNWWDVAEYGFYALASIGGIYGTTRMTKKGVRQIVNGAK
jgi:hypothetical protein